MKDARKAGKPKGPHAVRLPGFLIDEEEIGLGDAVKRMTYAMGVTPCGGCNRRAATLNRWVTFARRAPRREST
jgi:hypothetical protein